MIYRVCGGVLPGDAPPMTFAKLVTAELLTRLHEEHRPCAPRAYVDDMLQTAI